MDYGQVDVETLHESASKLIGSITLEKNFSYKYPGNPD